jgi:hypothetical protein
MRASRITFAGFLALLAAEPAKAITLPAAGISDVYAWMDTTGVISCSNPNLSCGWISAGNVLIQAFDIENGVPVNFVGAAGSFSSGGTATSSNWLHPAHLVVPDWANTINIIFPGISDFNYNYALGNASNFYSLNVSPVPIPASLPLFAAGIGALAFFSWRKKRPSALATYKFPNPAGAA